MGETLSTPKDSSKVEPTKRTYEPPKLSSYGTLRDITLHVGNRGNNDNGGGKGHDKTHVS